MPFMVIYRTADGSTRYEQADAIDEAARFVERLRNTEGSDEIRIFRMDEIKFAFRPYYKVELGMSDRRRTPTPGSPAAASAPRVVEVQLPSDPVEPAMGGDDDTEPAPAADEPQPLSPSALPPPPPAPSAGGEADANGSRRGLFGR
ncbi:MAG: hypothetical protein ACSLFP_15515 [Acidimicrobiales bacterium]